MRIAFNKPHFKKVFNFMKKILIGTVGYHNLRNHSIGSALLTAITKNAMGARCGNR
jgi:hypothetical protein